MKKKMAERGAQVLSGARNANMKIRWSVERSPMSERGTLNKKASERGAAIQKWAGARSAGNPRTGPIVATSFFHCLYSTVLGTSVWRGQMNSSVFS